MTKKGTWKHRSIEWYLKKGQGRIAQVGDLRIGNDHLKRTLQKIIPGARLHPGPMALGSTLQTSPRSDPEALEWAPPMDGPCLGPRTASKDFFTLKPTSR